MFAVNDLVVYPAQGVGQIESIDQQNIGGNACQLYTVRVRANNITLMVPVATAGHVGLRTLITKNEAQRLWKSLLTRTRPCLPGRTGTGVSANIPSASRIPIWPSLLKYYVNFY